MRAPLAVYQWEVAKSARKYAPVPPTEMSKYECRVNNRGPQGFNQLTVGAVA